MLLQPALTLIGSLIPCEQGHKANPERRERRRGGAMEKIEVPMKKEEGRTEKSKMREEEEKTMKTRRGRMKDR